MRVNNPAKFARRTAGLSAFLPALLVLGGVGCERPPDLVVYTSIDQEYAQQILALFESQTGLRVAAVYDTEAGKTTGLVRRLQRETAQPRCDVWWSSEVFGTIELARQNVLETYDSPAAADIPPAWKDPQRRWTGVAARARVLVYNPQHVQAAELPQSWCQLDEGEWPRRLALANPQFGTTRGHIAAMFVYCGEGRTRQFLQTLRSAGAQLADGNSQVVQLVATGAAEIGMTDTDDVWVAQRRGESVEPAYLPLEQGGPPLWIPCTVALVRGGPHGSAARRLIDFLVSAQAERILAGSDSRNVPVRADVRAAAKSSGPSPAPLDFDRIAGAMPAAMDLARDILLR